MSQVNLATNTHKSKYEETSFFFSPIILWQTFFFYIPLLFVFILSFIKLTDAGYQGVTLSNYADFFNLMYFKIIFKSLMLALSTSVICFIMGFPLAYFIVFRSGKFKAFFLGLLMLPFWSNFLLHIYAWFYVLERGGFLNTFLLKFGLISAPLNILNSLTAVMIGMVYSYLPFMVLPLYSILEQLNLSLIEASYDLGATVWQTLLRVIFPLSINGIISGLFLVFVPAFAEFAIPGLMGGEKFVFVGSVITQYILGNWTLTLGAAFTVISLIILIVFILLCSWLGVKIYNRFWV